MLDGADASFLQQVITDFTEDCELFGAGEFVFLSSFTRTDGFENVCFEHGVGSLDYSVIIQQRTVDLRPPVPLQYLSHAALRSLCNGH